MTPNPAVTIPDLIADIERGQLDKWKPLAKRALEMEAELAALTDRLAGVTQEREELPGIEKFLGISKDELEQDDITFLREDDRLSLLRKHHTAGIVRALCAMVIDSESLVTSLSAVLRELVVAWDADAPQVFIERMKAARKLVALPEGAGKETPR